LQSQEKLPLATALTYTRELLGALEHAHSHGVVHRDVKPANIILSDGSAVLTDFSVAHMNSAQPLTQTGTALGTPEYMSPEQFEGMVDHRADLYAVGVILYEMLIGVGPFKRDTLPETLRAQLFVTPTSVHQLDSQIPEAVSQFVDKALAKDRNQRFASAGEMLQCLKDLELIPAVALLALKVVSGPFAGQEIGLGGGQIMIGRDPGQCQLVIPASYAGISKIHCRASLSSGGDSVAVEDCGSSNGTFLDSGQAIPAGRPVLLIEGDRFYLSSRDVMFEVCLEAE
jgi:serine/threonine protein kinase